MDEWNSDEAPLASDLPPQFIKCHYQGGKSLGLTFEWLNDHFTISDDEHLKSINPTDQPEEPDEVMNGNGQLRQGDVLIEVNQQNIEKLTFDEIVSILKSCEPQDRILTFHRKESGEVVAVEPEDDNESESEESVAMNKTNNLPPNSSTCHRQLHQLFTSSPTLNLLHCQITNLSYFYRSRAELTSKKQLAFVIQQNSQHLRYDSSLYVIKVDQQDGNLKPMKKFLSSHSTRWGAYRHIEMKMKERDGNPFQTNSKSRGNCHGSNHSSVSGSRGFVGEVNPNDILSTHYRIQLVSEVFSGLNIYERLNLVYEVLTQEGYGKQYGPLYTSLGPQAGHESLDSCHLKHFSYVGKHVRNLPIFTFPNTDVNPLNLMIEPMTPSQWRPQLYSPPLSERYGKSHNEFRSQQVVVAAKPKAQRQRIKTLSMTNNNSSSPSMTSLPFFSSSSSSSVPHSATTSSHPSLGLAGPASPHSPSSQLNTQRIKQELYQSSAELLGLDSHILSQQFHKKTGGVYSHFFKDLSPGIKSLVMSRYLENKQLIQKEGGRMKSKHVRRGNIGDGPPPSAAAAAGGGGAAAGGGAGGRGRSNAAAPVTTMSIMKAKLEASKNSAEYDVGTSDEQEMMENYLLIVKKVEKFAICLQRIFRLKLFSIIQRRFYQCQVAVLTIQRVLRGRYGRVYYRLLRKLVPIAISRIITVYRAYQTRKRMKVWFALIQKATLVIAPILKRFVRKCVNLWLQRFHTAAKKIQSIIRLHLAKIKLYSHIGQKFYQEQLVCGVIRIQATYRGWKDRLRLRVLIEDYLRQVIDIPACILIQRIIRGILSKKVLQQKKLENFSAVRIQKYLLRWFAQLYYLRLKQVMLEKYAAITIQRIYRGRLDREVVRYHQERRWHREVYLPAVIFLQSIIRRYVTQKKYKLLQYQSDACLRIQLARRVYLAKKIFNIKKQNALKTKQGIYAKKIQTMIRSYLAKKRYQYLLYHHVGKRLYAAKVIIRAWKYFTYRRRYDVLLGEHRVKCQQQKVSKLRRLREEILQDLEEIEVDIQSTKSLEIKSTQRVVILNNFLIESEMRMSELEGLLVSVTSEDIANGWGESYSLEFDMLTYQKKLAREELRLRKRQLNHLQEESLELSLELEDTQLELDQLMCTEIESYEMLRQNEIHEIEKRVNRIREREVRMERCKWKVRSGRRKVIQRNRGYFNGIREKHESSRDMSYAITISHEKRAQRRDEEDIRIRRDERLAYQNLTKEVYRYENYAQPFQETYDDVIANSMSLLRNLTLDERVHRMQEAVHQKKKIERRKRGGLTAALKASHEETLTAFEKLNRG